MNEEKYFDKIIKHLNRKKSKPTYNSDKKPVKPIFQFMNNLGTEHNYIIMYVDYNYYYMTITYIPDKLNPYKVYIETQCTFSFKARQELGTKYWEDTWHSQEDVIEYIRYKLR